MSYELVYRSGKGNNYYWTNDQRFTRKMKNHYRWEKGEEIIAGLPQMMNNYPTLFSNKNNNRFYIYDLETKFFKPLYVSEAQGTTGQPKVDVAENLHHCAINLADHKDYAIAIDAEDGRYYFSTSKGEFLKDLRSSKIRRWKDVTKAAATANTIRVNKKIWRKYPQWDPLNDFVVNLRNGEIVWPSKEARAGLIPVENGNSNNYALILILLQQVRDQLQAHFQRRSKSPVNDDEDQLTVPQIDLETYNAEKVFEAFSYLTMALAQRELVNKALKTMDNGILQDYLHTVELANLTSFNADQFVGSLQ